MEDTSQKETKIYPLGNRFLIIDLGSFVNTGYYFKWDHVGRNLVVYGRTESGETKVIDVVTLCFEEREHISIVVTQAVGSDKIGLQIPPATA